MADQTFTVVLEVPHVGGRAWHWAAAEFDERLASTVIPPVLAADLLAEIRRGRDRLRLRVTVTVQAGDVGQAVTAALDVLEEAAVVGGFDLHSVTAEAGPAPLVVNPRSWAAGPCARRRRRTGSKRARSSLTSRPPGRAEWLNGDR